MWTGCVTEQHKDTEESRDGMETPTRIVSFRNKNPPQLQVRVSSMRVRKLPQLLRRTPSPRPAHKTAENTTSSREELLPEAPDNKAEQGLGLHTHSHTHTHTLTPTPTPPPPPESSLLTARTQPPSPSPAASLSNRRGEPRTAAETNTDPGGGTSGLPAASRPKRSECAPGWMLGRMR